MNHERLLAAEHCLVGSVEARKDVYADVPAAARALVPMDAFYLCLYEPKNRRLRFEYNGDEDGLDTPEIFGLGCGPTSRAILSGKAHVLNHIRDESSATLTFGDPGRRSRGAIHLPFWDGAPGSRGNGPPLGVLSVQSYSHDAYNRAEVGAVRWLAARAVHLLRETEGRAAREIARLAQAKAERARTLARVESILDSHASAPALRAALLAALSAGPEGSTLATESLTHRELQIVVLVAQGLTYGRVADALGIGRETVKTHLPRAYAKLGLPDGRALPRHLPTLLDALARRAL